jgi:hypothetical protein
VEEMYIIKAMPSEPLKEKDGINLEYSFGRL